MCGRTFQLRHFRLLWQDRERRDHSCVGCSHVHKLVRELVESGLTHQQCTFAFWHNHHHIASLYGKPTAHGPVTPLVPEQGPAMDTKAWAQNSMPLECCACRLKFLLMLLDRICAPDVPPQHRHDVCFVGAGPKRSCPNDSQPRQAGHAQTVAVCCRLLSLERSSACATPAAASTTSGAVRPPLSGRVRRRRSADTATSCFRRLTSIQIQPAPLA